MYLHFQSHVRYGKSQGAGGRTRDVKLVFDSVNYSLCSGTKIERHLCISIYDCDNLCINSMKSFIGSVSSSANCRCAG